jgi:NADPH:quinone reductase-like Zn-dependent oxidoreductase
MAREVVAPVGGSREDVEVRERELPAPAPGEARVEIRAVGVNPADWKRAYASWPREEAQPIGFEAAGVVTALGDGDSELQVGDEVIAFLVFGAYASELNVKVDDLVLKPDTLDFAQAANLLLVGTTASEMLEVTKVARGETILIHGASGAVGVSAVQQAIAKGAIVIGTASAANHELLRDLGAIPVAYGPGLEERVRSLTSAPIAAALDTVGTEEATEVSLALVDNPERVVTVEGAAAERAPSIHYITGGKPESAAYRKAARTSITDLAQRSQLTVPMATTFPLERAADAFVLLQSSHPGGKVALIP